MAIRAETLSIDSIPALLADVATQIRNETVSGELVKEDGDTAKWSTIFEKF